MFHYSFKHELITCSCKEVFSPCSLLLLYIFEAPQIVFPIMEENVFLNNMGLNWIFFMKTIFFIVNENVKIFFFQQHGILMVHTVHPCCLNAKTMSVFSHTGNVMGIMIVEITLMKNFIFAVRERNYIKINYMLHL